MEFNHIGRPSAGLKTIDVLGDDRRVWLLSLNLGDNAMPAIWLTRGDRCPSLVMKVPDLFWVAIESPLAREVFVVVLAPDAAVAAVCGDSAFGGEARAGEEDDAVEVRKSRRQGSVG